MTDRAHLLASIAETVADYRTGELASPTPEHVDRWVCQFSKKVQVPLLRELDHVLNQTYFTRAAVSAFLGNLVTNNKLAGANPLEFWKSAIHRVLSAAGSRRSRDRAGRQRVAAGLLLQRLGRCARTGCRWHYDHDSSRRQDARPAHDPGKAARLADGRRPRLLRQRI